MPIAFRAASSVQVNNAGAAVLPKPAGVVDGDVLLAIVAQAGNSAQVFTPPAGWVDLGISMVTALGTDQRARVFLHVAAGDGASYTFTSSFASGDIVAGAVAYSGVDNARPVVGAASFTYGSISGVTSTPLGGMWVPYAGCLEVVLAARGGVATSFTPPSGFTERLDSGTADGTVTADDQLYGAGTTRRAPATVTWTTSTSYMPVASVMLNPAGIVVPSTAHLLGSYDQGLTGDPATLQLPVGGFAAGDLLLLEVRMTGTSANAIVANPAGFTQVATLDALGVTTRVLAKISDGTETTAVIDWTNNLNNGRDAQVQVVRNGAMPEASALVQDAATGAHVLSLTTLTASDLLLMGAMLENSAVITHPAGTTLARKEDDRTGGLTHATAVAAPTTFDALDVAVAAVPGAVSYTYTIPLAQRGGYFLLAIPSTNQAPNAPVLLAPANAATTDLAGGQLFDWDFSDPNAPPSGADTSSAWYLRRKVAGAPAYEYWNAGTGAWQSTEVKNAGVATSVTFAAGKWANGVTYQWSVATEDALGVKGPYAPDFTVNGSTAATVTVTGPTGGVTSSSRPPVTWSEADAEGDPQQTYEVRVESGAYGTTPGAGTPVLASGALASSSARSWTPTADLVNGTTYRAFVRVVTNGQASAWAFSTFTMALTQPAAPTITLDSVGTPGATVITVTGHHNIVAFPIATYRVEFSDDLGATWRTVRGADALVPNGALVATAIDYEAPGGRMRRYRATTVGVV